jgi:pimeloyl-ACP methyl ester carboxylesterase
MEELAEHYDVVTFDPRGVGESSPILAPQVPFRQSPRP